MTDSRCLGACKRPDARLSHVRRASAAHEPGEPLSHWPVASLPRLEHADEATVPAVTAGFAIRAAFATLSPIGYKSTDSGGINPVRDRCSSTAALPATRATTTGTTRCTHLRHVIPSLFRGSGRQLVGSEYSRRCHAESESCQ